MADEYRIIRSRRPIGMNWLVQEGRWETRRSNLTGRERRVFEYVWEKEFPTRRAAEAFVEAEELRIAGREAENRPLTVAQANRLASGRVHVSQDEVDAALWAVSGDGLLEVHEPMTRQQWLDFLAQHAG
jgi:hypothetical protein